MKAENKPYIFAADREIIKDIIKKVIACKNRYKGYRRAYSLFLSLTYQQPSPVKKAMKPFGDNLKQLLSEQNARLTEFDSEIIED